MVLYTLAVNGTYSMTQLRSVTCHIRNFIRQMTASNKND